MAAHGDDLSVIMSSKGMDNKRSVAAMSSYGHEPNRTGWITEKIANNKDILAGPKVIEIEELKSSDRFYLAKWGDKIMTHSTPLLKYLLNFR